jgi:hypothetical protein
MRRVGSHFACIYLQEHQVFENLDINYIRSSSVRYEYGKLEDHQNVSHQHGLRSDCKKRYISSFLDYKTSTPLNL